LTAGAAAASREQLYAVSGRDSFTIGSQPASHIRYNGTERLQILKAGTSKHYVADARYSQTDLSGTSNLTAHFEQVLANGALVDRADQDPDELTVLNQPFTIQIDRPTLLELSRLLGSVPFDTNTRIAGGVLRGLLRHGADGDVDGTPSIGVRFSADGPMRGSLPDHPEIVIDGIMHMEGTAYYAVKDALLSSLQARLTIDGNLRDQKVVTPVHIVYERTFRADGALRWSDETQ
jgi:hypothetical protein